MDRFINNNDFDKSVIYSKLTHLASELKEEQNKNEEDRNFQKERELIYAQFIQGLKLSTNSSNGLSLI